ncbi:MAG: HAD family hydrolase, partial [Burkholderiales bacterium]
MRYSLIVFDWDGTLLDSAAGIVESIQAAARELQLPVPTHETASHVIGLGLQDSLRTAVPTLPEERYREFADAYRGHFRARQDAMSLFPGARELLHDLHAAGHRLALATGKSRRGLEHALEATALRRYFGATRCGDETQPKPHPAMLLELMEELAAPPEQSLMIGDTSHDLEMARSAHVDAVAVA